ncbi:MAG: response regulator [Dehalococcoidia bacterium]
MPGAKQPLICILDDDPSFLRMCHAILEPEGYDCVVPPDLKNPVAFVRKNPVDLVLMDLRLGHVTGLEVLHGLSLERATAEIPVVICTASRDLLQEHEELIERLGCAVVEKPFDVDDLLKAIKDCLARERAQA